MFKPANAQVPPPLEEGPAPPEAPRGYPARDYVVRDPSLLPYGSIGANAMSIFGTAPAQTPGSDTIEAPAGSDPGSSAIQQVPRSAKERRGRTMLLDEGLDPGLRTGANYWDSLITSDQRKARAPSEEKSSKKKGRK